MNSAALILFDGVCNLCNGLAKFIIKRDSQHYFRLASLQSIEGQKFLEEQNLPLDDFNTFILIENGKTFTKSTAALKVVRKLNGLWPLVYVFILIPPFVRDWVYNKVAKNRYKWFGKQTGCSLPVH